MVILFYLGPFPILFFKMLCYILDLSKILNENLTIQNEILKFKNIHYKKKLICNFFFFMYVISVFIVTSINLFQIKKFISLSSISCMLLLLPNVINFFMNHIEVLHVRTGPYAYYCRREQRCIKME